MKRRTFFGISSLLLTSKVSVANTTPEHASHVMPSACDELLCYIENPAEAAAIGSDYLTTNPDLNDTSRLLKSAGVHATKAGEVVSAFESQRQTDFAAGDTVVVDGWVLSNAEMSLCALVYIAQA